jgi:CheY-like chemotaxis protein
MRIHTDTAAAFLQSLATVIDKDPASLENWRCLHIARNADMSQEWIDATMGRLRDHHKDMDCEIIHCDDEDILFISRHLEVDEIYEIADDFIRANHHAQGEAGEIALYDMYHDWRIMKDLLLNKTPMYVEERPSPALYNFGEISSLREVFNDAKKQRTARMPLHVMIVEDDALTQRMVTGTFKDNYAIIPATNAQEAVTNYLMHAPDIVFLDIGLPDASGFDVLHQIMANDPHAYVVMFSGNSYLDNVAAAMSEGASGFVSKPFKKEKMRHYIEESAVHHRQYNA